MDTKKVKNLLLISLLLMSLTSCSAAGVLTQIKNAFRVTSSPVQNNDVLPSADPRAEAVTNDITVGVVDFDTYNPLLTSSTTVKDVCGFVFEPLFGIAPDFRAVPCLAQSSEVSKDGQSITITLKEGVTWHDGSAFTVEDVLYTIEYIRTNQTNYTPLLESISNVRKKGKSSINITFSRPVPEAVNLFSFPVIKKNSVKEKFDFSGTGPFRLESDKADTVLEAYEGYHGSRALIDKVYVKSIPDKEKFISLFNANEINIATSDIIDMTTFMPKSNAQVHDCPVNNMVIVGFNASSSKFNDGKTRRALSMLIDRNSIVSQNYFSRAVAAEYPVSPRSWLNPGKGEGLRSDESSALTLFSEAGWSKDERGVYFRWDGVKATYMTISIAVNAESEKKTAIAQSIADKLVSIGISANVVKYSTQEFINAVSQGNYEMFVGEIELMPNNDLTPVVGSGGNYFNYADSEVDILLAQMGTVQLEEDLKTVAHKLYSKLCEEMPFVPICFTKESIITGAKIAGGVNPSIENFVRETNLWSVK